MTDAAPAIFVALEQSGFAAAIRQSPWLYPAANVGHIISSFVCRRHSGDGRPVARRSVGDCSGSFARAGAQLRVGCVGGHGSNGQHFVLGRGKPSRAQPGVPVEGRSVRRRPDQCGDLRVLGQAHGRARCSRRSHARTRQGDWRSLPRNLGRGRRLRPQHRLFLGAVRLCARFANIGCRMRWLMDPTPVAKQSQRCMGTLSPNLPAPSAQSAGYTRARSEERARQSQEWRLASTMPLPLRLPHRDPLQCRTPMARAQG